MNNLKPSRNLAARPRGGCFLATFKPASGRNPVLAFLMGMLWMAVLAPAPFGAQAGVVLTSLHSFESSTNGAYPEAGLVEGSDGNLYGTTSAGGTKNIGTVFKIGTNGVLISLYSFQSSTNGSSPMAALAQGRDGTFYGTTYAGGTNGDGTVFRISTNGAYASLYSLTGVDGAGANGLVQGRDGNFYGTTTYGGTNDYGTVFKISANGALTSLYSFTNGNDGASPNGGLVQGNDGQFYGTTAGGGTSNVGTVFQISPSGALTSLYSFTNGNDGASPYGGLVQGNEGQFYGTATAGGTNNDGTVFKISASGVLTSLYSFTNGSDGRDPNDLVQGSDGNFYGTTVSGGTNNYGTVFKISTNGSLTSLNSFTGGSDGGYPQAGLAQGSDGKFYGTTYVGGAQAGYNGVGAVFQFSTNGALSGLYAFTGGHDGNNPQAGLVQGSDGNFYGATGSGGVNNAGTVFKISTNGGYTILYSFTNGNDGSSPNGLAAGSDGNLYGTTELGGTGGTGGRVGPGTVFQISTNGVLTSLYSFRGFDGAFPQAGLVQGSDGEFYGTTAAGPFQGYYNPGYGTVFKISTNGMLTSLYFFTGGNDGGGPAAALVQGSDGCFYGTTGGGGTNGAGTVFKIGTNQPLISLYSFTGTNDGSDPNGVVQGRDGYFYGTAQFGGTSNVGTVFKISTNGALTNLYSFTGSNGGYSPRAGLVQGSDGSFYGTTRYSGVAGQNGPGTVFKINTNGTLTNLYSFTGGLDGEFPSAGLVQGSDGSFYGTTSSGGPVGAGTVFRLALVPEFVAATLTDGTLSLTWSTEAVGTYQLQYNSDLSSSQWTNLGSAMPATGAMLNLTDYVTNGPQRFYRVKRLH
ncbi:MAG: choice-of-anchor tandem repeat GloVer-containing protein [Verrucomicrobiota bacterium]|jgi:uncharacterized repeat protein (TIGR03803 family)